MEVSCGFSLIDPVSPGIFRGCAATQLAEERRTGTLARLFSRCKTGKSARLTPRTLPKISLAESRRIMPTSHTADKHKRTRRPQNETFLASQLGSSRPSIRRTFLSTPHSFHRAFHSASQSAVKLLSSLSEGMSLLSLGLSGSLPTTSHLKRPFCQNQERR